MPVPDLSIVIVSYQVREHLARCLESLARESADLSLEVLVVDNDSTDGSPDLVSTRFPEVLLIRNGENVGFASANNQGLERASGRYRMLLNPDTEIPKDVPNPLKLLVEFMDSHPNAGACGASLFYPDGKRQHSAFHFPSLAQIYIDLFPVNWRVRESRLNGRYALALYERGEPFLIDHPLGAALLARPETIAQVGLLDPDYFIYAEEVDWCLRIKRARWEIWCVPQARIIHHEGQSTRQFRDRMYVELWKARFTLFRKNYSRSFNSAAKALVRRGMKRAENEARAGAARDEMTGDELARRISAYEQVARMAQ